MEHMQVSLMPMESRNFFWKKITLNFRFMAKHHYCFFIMETVQVKLAAFDGTDFNKGAGFLKTTL